jgi:hypothetical protein
VQTPFSPPNIETITDNFRQKGKPPPKYFTICDAVQGYLQLPLSAESQRLCGIETPHASYTYQFMPLGLVSSGFEYNKVMAKIINSVNSIDVLNCLNYIDDIVLWSNTYQEHLDRLERLLQRLTYYRLRLKPSKCQFMKKQVHFLGLILNGQGVAPDERKCELISKLKSPTNQKNLRSFLSLMSYFRKFIHHFSDHTAIFSPLLKKNAIWKWTNDHEQKFIFLKELLKMQPIMLNHPQWEYPFKLICDSSQVACGYCLVNETPQGDKVILYGSRLWSDAEKKYHSNRLELLGICHAVTRCHRFLAFRKFTIITDNVSSSFVKGLSKQRGPLFRLGTILANYNFDIRHRTGKTMMADYLSRQEVTGDEATPDDNHVTLDDEMIMAVDNEQTLTINQPLALAINWSNKTSSCYLADWTDEEPFNPVQLSCKDDIVFSSNKHEGCTDEPHTVISATSRCSRNTKKRVRFADECQDAKSAATTHDDDDSTDATV